MSDSEITYQSYFVASSEFSTTNDNDIRDCATSGPAANNIGVRNDKKGKAKAERKSVGPRKTIGDKKKKASSGGKGTPAPTYNQVTPRLCIGLFVCMDHNGGRYVGTPTSYNYKTKLYRVVFEDERVEYMEQKDVLKYMALGPDIQRAQQALKAKLKAEQISADQERMHAIGDASTSTNVNKVPYVAARMRASNA